MSEIQLEAAEISNCTTDCSLLIDGIPSINNFENFVLNTNLHPPSTSSSMSSPAQSSNSQRELSRLQNKVLKLEDDNRNLYLKIQLLETDVLLLQSETSTFDERTSEVLNRNKKITEECSRLQEDNARLKDDNILLESHFRVLKRDIIHKDQVIRESREKNLNFINEDFLNREDQRARQLGVQKVPSLEDSSSRVQGIVKNRPATEKFKEKREDRFRTTYQDFSSNVNRSLSGGRENLASEKPRVRFGPTEIKFF